MEAARRFLAGLGLFERIACGVAFVVMAGALIADVGMREITGAGILGAPQVGVIGMIAVAMFGFGLAASTGGQLRAKFFDGLVPRSLEVSVGRIADLITAAMLALLAWLASMMMAESAALRDVTSVLRWPIWPMQAIIVVSFGLNAIRYLLFATYPELRPIEDPSPETAEIEDPVR
jgi:C4-dicarboxylate transporter, DctQ subunit